MLRSINRSRKSRKRWSLTGTVFLFVLLIGIPLFFIAQIEKIPARATALNENNTWLIIGTDSREKAPSFDEIQSGAPDSERADIILLAKPNERGLEVVSVPRDTAVRHGAGERRLTLLYRIGPQQVANALCRDLDVPVQHVVEVDMNAVMNIVDAVGGITVTADAPTRDKHANLNLEEGENQLNGREAIAYVRSRHPEVFKDGKWQQVSDTVGAVDRQSHSAEVLKLVVSKVSNTRNPFTLMRLAWVGTNSLKIDEASHSWNFTQLANHVRSSEVLPSHPYPELDPWAVQVSAEETEPMLEGFTGSCSVR